MVDKGGFGRNFRLQPRKLCGRASLLHRGPHLSRRFPHVRRPPGQGFWDYFVLGGGGGVSLKAAYVSVFGCLMKFHPIEQAEPVTGSNEPGFFYHYTTKVCLLAPDKYVALWPICVGCKAPVPRCHAPLDRWRIIQQATPGKRGRGDTIWAGLRAMHKEGGLRSFWRGNGTHVLKPWAAATVTESSTGVPDSDL